MITAILSLGGLGLLAAVGLGIASKVFYVYINPKIIEVEDALAGANCGGCGYPGCSSAAEAIVAGRMDPNGCVAGGEEVAAEVAAVMGVEVKFKEAQLSLGDCSGGLHRVKRIYDYIGVHDCRAVDMLARGDSICTHSCLGYGTCMRNCPFDAIVMDEHHHPLVSKSKCTGCGTCVKVCPHDAIHLVSESDMLQNWLRESDCAAPCETKCPTQIDIPTYIKHIQRGEYAQAVQVIKQHNPLPLVCGRVCPHPCEDVCRRIHVDEAVAINDLKRFASDYEYYTLKRHTPVFKLPDTGHKVAIIGGGTAGLSAAYFLRRLGHHPTIIEKLPKLGGALHYGIPAYRLPKDILAWEIEGITDLGVEVRTETEFGVDVTFEQLQTEGFEAYFLAGGTPTGFSAGVPGEDLDGVIKGVDYLRQIGLGQETGIGERVLVIGGGNVAVDVALSAMRDGAKTVYLACIEDRHTMPAWEHEVQDLLVEGILLTPTWGMKEFSGQDGKIVGATLKRCLKVFDDEGRFSPVYDDEQLMHIALDTVIITIGQGTDVDFMAHSPVTSQVELSRRKTVVVDPDTLQTNVECIFAGAEITTGPGLAIEAIAAGRKAALSIQRYLSLESRGRLIPYPDLRREVLDLAVEEEYERIPRTEREIMSRIPVKHRFGTWREVSLGLTEEQALREADRCLDCGVFCFGPHIFEAREETIATVSRVEK